MTRPDIIFLPETDYEKVLAGEKTMVIRPPAYRLNMAVHDWIAIVFDNKPDNNMLVEIQDIQYLHFKDLNSNHAEATGFQNVDDLKKALVKHYTTLDSGSVLYAYKFEVMGVSEKVGE